MRKYPEVLFGIVFNCMLAGSVVSAYAVDSPAGTNFTVDFPAPAVLFKFKGQTAKGIRFGEFRWRALNKEGYWGVAVFLYAEPRKVDYDANIAGAVAGAKGRLVSQKLIRQVGVEGREIVINGPNSIVTRERIIWVGDRLYFIVFSGNPGSEANPDVEAFLDSFRIVN